MKPFANPKSLLTSLLGVLLYFPLFGQISVAHRVIVRFQPGMEYTDQFRERIGAERSHRYTSLQMETWNLPKEWELADQWLCSDSAFLQYIRQHFPVLYVEPDYLVRSASDSLPNDPDFPINGLS